MAYRRALMASIILSAFVTIGCESPQAGLAVRDRHELEKNGRAVFGRPIALSNAELLMFPFAIETDQEQKGWAIGSISGGQYAVSGSSGWERSGSSSEFYGGRYLSWNNVAFYDPKTGMSRLLLDRPALITEFHSPGEKGGPVFGNYLLFAIATEDSNRDGVIGAADAVRLYRAAANGLDLTPITAADTQLLDVQSFGQLLIVRLVRDVDHDGKFTSKDPVEVLQVDSQTWQPPTNVISDELRKQAFDAAIRPRPTTAPSR